MEEQRQFAKILHPNGHGIALRYETPDINVGDICYWDDAGKATRILNIFENKSVRTLKPIEANLLVATSE